MSKVVYLAGPTGAGKSTLALAAAQAFGATIVNADAFQLYRGLEILSAVPTEEEQTLAPHHLYGALPLDASCDAAHYASMARTTLAELASRETPVIVVGGSGLYLKALTHGLSDLPSDAALRAELAEQSLEEKVRQLRTLDPSGAASINLTNPRHVERALEICLLTGRPASEARATWSAPDPPHLRGLFLTWPRDHLYHRIETRTRMMFEMGVVEEVTAIANTPISPNAAKMIGLKEVRAFLAGECTREAAIAEISQATRRYAKRQETWFRRERWLKTVCLNAHDTPDSFIPEISALFANE